MQRLSYTIILLNLTLLFFSCNKENAPDIFKSTGEIKTQTRLLPGFHTLYINDHIEIEIKQANEHKAEITAGKNLIPKIKLEVEDSTLTIRNRNTANWVRSYQKDDVKITLYMPIVKKIYQYGSGKIFTTDTLKLRDKWLDIENHSSGDIDITADCLRLACSLSRRGYGNITLKGKCTQLISINDGTGTYNSLSLSCQYARVETINKGESYAYVPGPLAVRIMDSGNIYITGNPSPIEWLEKKGSGSLILR
ncbi:MAG: DUF2807 domain-containing protein [Bacteroidia bacterium]|nr:DUF2807 domain-containing protein [Bacteroidia bacterium]MDW8347954.1 DUF2807 domain-containing protein [Bacteroidia bacterium]